MNILKTAAASITALGLLTGAAAAQKTEPSYQTHYGPETLSGNSLNILDKSLSVYALRKSEILLFVGNNNSNLSNNSNVCIFKLLL